MQGYWARTYWSTMNDHVIWITPKLLKRVSNYAWQSVTRTWSIRSSTHFSANNLWSNKPEFRFPFSLICCLPRTPHPNPLIEFKEDNVLSWSCHNSWAVVIGIWVFRISTSLDIYPNWKLGIWGGRGGNPNIDEQTVFSLGSGRKRSADAKASDLELSLN